MILYILSIIVFIAIASLIGFLLGRATIGKRLKRMERQMKSLKYRDEEMESNYHELLDQLKIQGRELERSKIREQKLDEILQKLTQEKKRLAAESIETKLEIKEMRKRQEEISNKWAMTETREREALRWRNEYVRLNYTLEDKLRRLENDIEQQKQVKESPGLEDYSSDTSKYELQENTSDADLSKVEDLKNEIADLQIKAKRQDHIIRALRMQLKNLNIEKIKNADPHTLENDDFDETQDVEIQDYEEEMLAENDFREAMDEIVGKPDEIFPESLSFKEKKLRKTGKEVLDFTKVHQRVMQGQKSLEESNEEKEHPTPMRMDWSNLLGEPAKKSSNLSLIFNMDNEKAKVLKSIGINSFEQLSRMKPQHFEYLEKELGLPVGTIEGEKWVQQAGNLCSEENINSIFLRTRNHSESIDKENMDLTKIRGIGRTYKKRLEASGINSIADLASWEEDNIEELAALIDVSVEKIERERWLHQAKQLYGKYKQYEE